MKWLKRVALVMGLLLLILAAVPFFLTLNDYIPQIEKEVSAKLGVPVAIQNLSVVALPLPHLTVDGITVGRRGEFSVGKVTVTPDLLSLFSRVKVVSSIQIDSLQLSKKAIDRIPGWIKPQSTQIKPAQVVVRSLILEDATVRMDKASFGPFAVRIQLNAQGDLGNASVTTKDGKLKAQIKPGKAGYLVDLVAKSWTSPVGAPIFFDQLSILAVARASDASLNQISARLYGGTVNGKAEISWLKGLQLKGNFNINQVELKTLVPLLAPGRRISGKFSAKPVFSSRAPAANQLTNALRLETPFEVRDGIIYGVDIEKAATSVIKRDTGGETRFEQLSGHLSVERGTQRFTDLKIATGALAASGHVSISPKKELSGRVNAEVKASTMASASVPLNVTGTVESPMLLPTGGTLAGAAVGTAILGPGLGTSIGAKVGGWAEGLFGSDDKKK